MADNMYRVIAMSNRMGGRNASCPVSDAMFKPLLGVHALLLASIEATYLWRATFPGNGVIVSVVSGDHVTHWSHMSLFGHWFRKV